MCVRVCVYARPRTCLCSWQLRLGKIPSPDATDKYVQPMSLTWVGDSVCPSPPPFPPHTIHIHTSVCIYTHTPTPVGVCVYMVDTPRHAVSVHAVNIPTPDLRCVRGPYLSHAGCL